MQESAVLLVTSDADELFQPSHYYAAFANELPNLDWARIDRGDHAFSTCRRWLVSTACNGRRTARQIMTEMRMDEHQLLEELKLLVRTRWIAFASGEEQFSRLAQE